VLGVAAKLNDGAAEERTSPEFVFPNVVLAKVNDGAEELRKELLPPELEGKLGGTACENTTVAFELSLKLVDGSNVNGGMFAG